jgi:hypothetical protein
VLCIFVFIGKNIYSVSLLLFKNCLIFLLLSFKNYLYILDVLDNIPYHICDLQMCFPNCRLPFHCVNCLLCCTELFSLMYSHLFSFLVKSEHWVGHQKKQIIFNANVKQFLFSRFPSRTVITLGLSFRSFIHFECNYIPVLM